MLLQRETRQVDNHACFSSNYVLLGWEQEEVLNCPPPPLCKGPFPCAFPKHPNPLSHHHYSTINVPLYNKCKQLDGNQGIKQCPLAAGLKASSPVALWLVWKDGVDALEKWPISIILNLFQGHRCVREVQLQNCPDITVLVDWAKNTKLLGSYATAIHIFFLIIFQISLNSLWLQDQARYTLIL